MMKRPLHLLAPTLALGALAPLASAGTTYLPTAKDNTLYEDPAGGLSNGAGEHLFVGLTSTGQARRVLLEFDFSSLPPGSVVDSVSFRLHMSMSNAGPVDVSLHRVLTEWGEGTSDAPGGEGGGTAARAGDATWLHTFFPTTTWGSVGGDYAALTSDVQSVDGVGDYSWSSAQMAADVQGWVNDATTNHGWLMRAPEFSASTTKRFDSKENSTGNFHPLLVVEFTPPPPGSPYCFGVGCPCGNDDPSAGCAHSNGAGAALVGRGLGSVTFDGLYFEASDLVPNEPALLFVANNAIQGGAGSPFGDGLRCAGGSLRRLGTHVAGGTGDAFWGPGLNGAGGWSAGDTRRFQGWYRDPQGSPCGNGFNMTNGYEVTFSL